MKRAIFCLIWFDVVSQFLPVYSQVVLSEIMFDAAGSESHNEFIEIVNLSESTAVDLTNWQISDGSSVDHIVAVDQGTQLQPGQFAVILDGSYFGNSTTYDNLIPVTALIVTIDDNALGSAGLSNSSPETISLINPAGEVVSSYTYSLGNTPGFSDEKIDLAGPNQTSNWADSKVFLGTPGAPNSVSPSNFDLGLSDRGISFSPAQVGEGEPLAILATIENVGRRPVSDFRIHFFEDLDGNGLPEDAERIAPPRAIATDVLPADSVTVSVEMNGLSAGRHLIMVWIDFPADEDSTNNLAQKNLLVGFLGHTLVINEIMYSPLPDQSEWVELFNHSSQAINLKDWSISDSDNTSRHFVEHDVFIQPNEFFVLAENSSLRNLFSLPESSFEILESWPNLNNNFDTIVLYDLTGKVIDEVNYSESWGGESGFSLERINPNLPANDRSNWSSSVAREGGTPAAQNSIFLAVQPSDVTLAVEPNPFSPNGDGKEDFAMIHYNLPLPTAAVNVKIYDIRGRLIRFLANNAASGSSNTLIWDGSDDRDETARMGIYIIFLQAINAEDGVLLSAKKTVVLASQL